MNITVIGGTGSTGTKIIELAIEKGIDVKTLVRSPEKIAIGNDDLKVIQGDARDAAAVAAAIEGSEVVLSGLGADGLGETTIYSDSIVHIIAGMKKHGVKRLLCIGAVGQDPDRSGEMPFLGKLVINLLLKKTLADMYKMQQALEASDLDWTMMWPPRLNDGPVTGKYRVANDKALKKGSVISRADLAHFMINNISETAYYRRRTSIAY